MIEIFFMEIKRERKNEGTSQRCWPAIDWQHIFYRKRVKYCDKCGFGWSLLTKNPPVSCPIRTLGFHKKPDVVRYFFHNSWHKLFFFFFILLQWIFQHFFAASMQFPIKLEFCRSFWNKIYTPARIHSKANRSPFLHGVIPFPKDMAKFNAFSSCGLILLLLCEPAHSPKKKNELKQNFSEKIKKIAAPFFVCLFVCWVFYQQTEFENEFTGMWQSAHQPKRSFISISWQMQLAMKQ